MEGLRTYGLCAPMELINEEQILLRDTINDETFYSIEILKCDNTSSAC